jgi:hypothetical protein
MPTTGIGIWTIYSSSLFCDFKTAVLVLSLTGGDI